MKLIFFSCVLNILAFGHLMGQVKTAQDILQRAIITIDTIETIYFKQEMVLTNPRNLNDTIHNFREMYFKRLRSDSIVGVNGHWYMCLNDTINVVFEDIYDGNRLIRINNRDSSALIFDLEKHPDFRKKHFWSHNTLYGMQYEFKFILSNLDSYSLTKLNDTLVDNVPCFQIQVGLENKMSMPGFASKLKESNGMVSNTTYYINKETYYPIKMIGEGYSVEKPDQKMFIDQRYYNIKFNVEIIEDIQFNTSDESIVGFKIREMKPLINN